MSIVIIYVIMLSSESNNVGQRVPFLNYAMEMASKKSGIKPHGDMAPHEIEIFLNAFVERYIDTKVGKKLSSKEIDKFKADLLKLTAHNSGGLLRCIVSFEHALFTNPGAGPVDKQAKHLAYRVYKDHIDALHPATLLTIAALSITNVRKRQEAMTELDWIKDDFDLDSRTWNLIQGAARSAVADNHNEFLGMSSTQTKEFDDNALALIHSASSIAQDKEYTTVMANKITDEIEKSSLADQEIWNALSGTVTEICNAYPRTQARDNSGDVNIELMFKQIVEQYALHTHWAYINSGGIKMKKHDMEIDNSNSINSEHNEDNSNSINSEHNEDSTKNHIYHAIGIGAAAALFSAAGVIACKVIENKRIKKEFLEATNNKDVEMKEILVKDDHGKLGVSEKVNMKELCLMEKKNDTVSLKLDTLASWIDQIDDQNNTLRHFLLTCSDNKIKSSVEEIINKGREAINETLTHIKNRKDHSISIEDYAKKDIDLDIKLQHLVYDTPMIINDLQNNQYHSAYSLSNSLLKDIEKRKNKSNVPDKI